MAHRGKFYVSLREALPGRV